MNKSRLYELFSALDAEDRKALKKWVRSPFFNQRDHVVALFDYLALRATKAKPAPDRRDVFHYIWPDLPFDDHKLRLSMSLLSKCIEQYLLWKQVNKEEASAKLKICEAYRELGLNRHYERLIKETSQLMEAQDLRDASYFQNRHAYFLEQYHFTAQQNRMEGIPLEDVQNNLDIAYLATKLKQSCSMLSHQAIYRKEYSFGMLPEVLEYIEQNNYLEHPAISVYYYAYKALGHDAHETYFDTFKAALVAHQKHFKPAEVRDLFLLATNYCIQQLNRGFMHYAQIGLDIYKEGLKSKVLLNNGVISNFTYSNIVAKAIVCKDFDWAVQFAESYKTLLEPQHQQDTFFYNMAWLKYEQQEYDAALSHLNQVNVSDLLLNIAAKTIAMKIYYELESFDLLHSHLEAMRTFLHRKKMMAYHKESYANTIKYLKKILDLPLGDKARRAQVRQQITDVKAIAERKWLLRQLS